MQEVLSRARLQHVRLERGRSQALVIPACAPPADPGRRHEIALVLRSMLARLTGDAPASLRLERTGQGKPTLGGPAGLAFNVSHSRAYSLIAISSAGDIGCDIEDRFGDEDVMGLCPAVLHSSELDAMERLAPHERQDAFRRYWVRKEAVLKAAGSGFLRDPRHVVTGLDRPSATWLGEQGPAFVIHDRRIEAGCLAAVASMDAACSWHLLDG